MRKSFTALIFFSAFLGLVWAAEKVSAFHLGAPQSYGQLILSSTYSPTGAGPDGIIQTTLSTNNKYTGYYWAKALAAQVDSTVIWSDYSYGYGTGRSYSASFSGLAAGDHQVGGDGRFYYWNGSRYVFWTNLSVGPATVNIPAPTPAPTVDILYYSTGGGTENRVQGPLNIAHDSVWLSGNTGIVWTSTNATSCTASGDWSGTKGINSSQGFSPALGVGAHTYTITCAGPGGTSNPDSVVINVYDNAFGSIINANDTHGSITIPYNTSAMLSWGVFSGNSFGYTCSASSVPAGWTGTKLITDTESTGNLTLSKTYRITCVNPISNSEYDEVTVNVAAPAATADITASPTVNGTYSNGPIGPITYNTPAYLRWSSANAASCSISPVIAGATIGTSNSTGLSTGNLTANTTYTLTCGAATDTVTINVAAPTLTTVLTPSPATGTGDTSVTLSASAGGTAIGTINYSFWWNCSNVSNSVSTVSGACGSLTTPTAGSCSSNANGYKCNGVTANPQATSAHTYTPGTYTSKVIVERGAAVSVEARQTVTIAAPAASFAYSLSNSGNITSIKGGTAGSNTITITKTGGTAAAVTLSASEVFGPLPAGVTAAFNPASCTPDTTCTSTLTLTAASTAAAETNTILVSGSPAGGTTSFTLTVQEGLVASCSVNKTRATLNESVIWSAAASGGLGNYAYLWGGTAPLAGKTGSQESLAYNSAGNKTGSVTVTSSGQIITVDCSNAVDVYTPVLKILPSSGDVKVDETKQFAVDYYPYGLSVTDTKQDITASAHWFSSDNNKATVNDTSNKGLITGVGAGSANIHASYTDAYGNFIATSATAGTAAAVTVSQPTPLEVSIKTHPNSPGAVLVNQDVTFEAKFGIGGYKWSGGGVPPGDQSGQNNEFTTKYTTAGSKTITVTSGLQSQDDTFIVADPRLSISNFASDPALGQKPLSASLAARITTNIAGATNNYTFWWNCTNTSTSVSEARGACGDPNDDANGAKFDGVPAEEKSVSHAYSSSSFGQPSNAYSAKVIVERGSAPPVERRILVTVGSADIKAFANDGPITVESGTIVGLSWTSENVTSCAASGTGPGWSGSKPVNGSENTPALTETGTFRYTLTCSGPNDLNISDYVDITVGGGAGGLTASCQVNKVKATRLQPVTWSATASGGTGDDYYYTWEGRPQEGEPLQGETITVHYTSPGDKTMSVGVWNDGQTVTVDCGSSVTVYTPVLETSPNRVGDENDFKVGQTLQLAVTYYPYGLSDDSRVVTTSAQWWTSNDDIVTVSNTNQNPNKPKGLIEGESIGDAFTYAAYTNEFGVGITAPAAVRVSPADTLVIDSFIIVPGAKGDNSLEVAVSSNISGVTNNYTFYCDRAGPDSDTAVTDDWDHKSDGVSEMSYATPAGTCNYASPGTYTAKVIVERGGLATAAHANITIPPNTAPTVNPITPVAPANYCTNPFGWTLKWNFADADGDSQQSYQVVVIDKATGAIVKDSGRVVSSSNSYALPLGTLDFNKTYSWAIKVWESDAARLTAVAVGADFTTIKHAAPALSFNITPARPSRDEQVTLTDTTVVSGGAIKIAWNWDFTGVDGVTLLTPTSGPQVVVKFSTSGSKNVKLKVTDSDGLNCEKSANDDAYDSLPAITVGRGIPSFREILPRFR